MLFILFQFSWHWWWIAALKLRLFLIFLKIYSVFSLHQQAAFSTFLRAWKNTSFLHVIRYYYPKDLVQPDDLFDLILLGLYVSDTNHIKKFRSTKDTKQSAYGLYKYILKLETAIYLIFWDEILGEIKKCSKKLQSPSPDLNRSISRMKSLKSFVNDARQRFLSYEKEAKQMSGQTGYATTKERRHTQSVRLNAPGEQGAETVVLDAQQTFKTQCFLPVIDMYSHW